MEPRLEHDLLTFVCPSCPQAEQWRMRFGIVEAGIVAGVSHNVTFPNALIISSREADMIVCVRLA